MNLTDTSTTTGAIKITAAVVDPLALGWETVTLVFVVQSAAGELTHAAEIGTIA